MRRESVVAETGSSRSLTPERGILSEMAMFRQLQVLFPISELSTIRESMARSAFELSR